MADEYGFHPIANLFPMMDDEGLAELAADIKAKGLKEQVKLWRGQIIDGRNRYRACKIAKVEPIFKEMKFADDEAALDYVVSRNLKRRHMSAPQRSITAVKIANMRRGRPGKIGLGTDLKSQAQAADMLDVSVASVGRAKVVVELAPELLEQVRAGKMGLREAADIARHGAQPKPEPEPLSGIEMAARASANAAASKERSAKFIVRVEHDREALRAAEIAFNALSTEYRLKHRTMVNEWFERRDEALQ